MRNLTRTAVAVVSLLGTAYSLAASQDAILLWGNYRTNDDHIIAVGRAPDDPAAPFLMDFKTNRYRTLVPQPSGDYCADDCRTRVTFHIGKPAVTGLSVSDEAGSITAHHLPMVIEDTTFSNGDVAFKGRFLKPTGSGPFPAVVIIGGTGKNLRDDFRAYPYFFVLHGFAVLAYDKRGAGESGGDPSTPQEGTELLAGDAQAAIAALRARPDVDPVHVGIMGISHGAWPAVEVAARDSEIAFLLPTVGGGVPQWQAQLFDLQCQMRAEKFTVADIAEATALMRKFYELAANNEFAKVPALIAANKDKKWFSETPAAPMKELPPAIVMGASARIWNEELSVDPGPRLRLSHAAVFAMVAENDVHVPPKETAAAIRRATSKSGAPATILFLRNANHWQQVGGPYSANFMYPPELFATLGTWLEGLKHRWALAAKRAP